jgi:prolyl-tRNA synthetase
MRLSRAHFSTLRDFPADAEVASHKLMAKAGLILKTGVGIYTYGPLFLRSLKKIMAIVCEEMDRTGAQEMLMPILQPVELWEQSGRLENYRKARILWESTDRKGTTYALGPTHEEVITDYVGRTVNSYKQLPITLYQQQDKFRDEIRPRFGLMRGREFIMKDAYSFDADAAGLDISYQKMRDAYHRIFQRCGLEFIAVQADPGAIGGSGSEEFMVVAESGEDEILFSHEAGYAANTEKASSEFDPPYTAEHKPIRKESTPNIKSVDELVAFFAKESLSAARMVKTILYNVAMPGEKNHVTVAVLMRGDQEINEVKLANALGALAVELADEATVKRVTGADVGFAGPIGFKTADGKGYTIRVIADRTVKGMCNFLCGCNATDFHSLDVKVGRVLPEPEWVDVRKARVGEFAPGSEHALT